MSVQVTEDEIIRRKLLVDGEGMGDDRRIEILMKSFVKWCNATDENDQDSCVSMERLLTTVDACERSMAKSQQIMAMNREEVKNYGELYQEIERQLKETNESIDRTRSELEKARQIRANKQQYHVLASVIQKEPDREMSRASLDKLEREMQTLGKRKDALSRAIDNHHRQFQVLLSAAQQLEQLYKTKESEADFLDESLEEGETKGDSKLDDLSDEDTAMVIS